MLTGDNEPLKVILPYPHVVDNTDSFYLEASIANRQCFLNEEPKSLATIHLELVLLSRYV